MCILFCKIYLSFLRSLLYNICKNLILTQGRGSGILSSITLCIIGSWFCFKSGSYKLNILLKKKDIFTPPWKYSNNFDTNVIQNSEENLRSPCLEYVNYLLLIHNK